MHKARILLFSLGFDGYNHVSIEKYPDVDGPIIPGQFWKIEGNGLKSMSHATLGIHQEFGLVAYFGNSPLISPIKVDIAQDLISEPLPVPGN